MTHVVLLAVALAADWTAPLAEADISSWATTQSPVDQLSVAIQRLATLHRARALEAEGSSDSALALLEPLAISNDPLGLAARFDATRLRLLAGARPTARMRTLFAESGGPTVRWGITRQSEAAALLLLGNCYEREGSIKLARSVRLLAALQYPRWAPELADMTRAERLQRARNLVRDMDYEDGLTLLDQLTTTATDKERRRLLREIGHLLGDKMRRNYQRVVEIFTELTSGPDTTADDLLYLAYATGKLDPVAAADVYERFVVRFPEHPGRAKASFLVAWTEFDLEHLQSAVAAFDAFIKSYPGSSYGLAARWYRGLALFRLGDYEAAREDFEYTASHSRERARGRYWTARALLELGRSTEALPLLTHIAADEPFSYYGIMARALLPEQSQPPLFERQAPAAPVGMTDEQAERIAAALPERVQVRLAEGFAALQVDEPGLAIALLAHLEQTALAGASLASFRYWLERRLGAAHRIVLSAEARTCRRRLNDDPSAPAVESCWRALYPEPYAEQIEEVRGKVPATLFWAIMRQESFFDPQARSHADALGLMQVIPQVGGPAAETLGCDFAPYELYRPQTNLQLFAVAVRERFERFDGHVPLILMSYNATPSKALEWLQDNADMPFDLFVEEIPWSETRHYVKAIAEHFARYRTLNGRSSAPLLDRAGLPHPRSIVGQTFLGVLHPDVTSESPASLGYDPPPSERCVLTAGVLPAAGG